MKETSESFNRVIAKDSNISATGATSWITASYLAIGYPLKGYNYTLDTLDRYLFRNTMKS